MGGGGQVDAIDYHPLDGTAVVRTDTYGGYLYVTSGSCTGWGGTYPAPCWQQLITATSIPSPSISYPYSLTATAIVEVVACNKTTGGATATNDLYMWWEGNAWFSSNKGATWVKMSSGSPLATTTNPNNGTTKTYGQYIACDPNNPDIAYFGSNTGLYVTTNGTSGASATFTLVNGLAAPTNCPSGNPCVPPEIAFDPTSPVVGNVTQHFFVGIVGTGVYETSNGGSLSLISGSPTGVSHPKVDQWGQLWVPSQGSGVYRYQSGSGSTFAVGGSSISSVAFDPNSPSKATNHVVLSQFNGALWNTTNNAGTSFTGGSNNQTYTAGTGQPGWMANADQQDCCGNKTDNTMDIAFDTSSNLLDVAGIGIWQVNSPVSGTSVVKTANTIGVENLQPDQIKSGPGSSPVSPVWDRGFFSNANPDAYPSSQFTNSGGSCQIIGGWNVDYATLQGTFWTGWQISNICGTLSPGYSTDGGHTWTAWANNPSLTNAGGNVAASTPTNWITIAGCAGCIGGSTPVLSYTTNGATSAWNTSSFTGGTPNAWGLQVGARQALAADRGNANSFCAVDGGTGTTGSQKFWYSSNSGATFAKQSATVDGQTNADEIIGVLNTAGTFLYTAGSQGGAHPASSHLWLSTNSCASFSEIPSSGLLKEVIAVGTGAPKPGSSNPAIYAYGWYNGTLGIWQSNDLGTTFAEVNVPSGIDEWPNNSVDFVRWVEGDANVYGRIYVSLNGSGNAYIDTQDACPWVNFSNTNPNASLTGTVTLQAQSSGLVPATGVSFYVDGSLIGTQTNGSGTPTTYSQSWVTGEVAAGSHTLQVAASGNGCTATASSAFANFSIPITTH